MNEKERSTVRHTLPGKLLSRVRLLVIPWTVAYQDPPSMEFSRQEFWSGLPFPSPGDLFYPGVEPRLVGWHHQLNGHEFEQASGDSEGQGSLVSCNSWDHSWT